MKNTLYILAPVPSSPSIRSWWEPWPVWLGIQVCGNLLVCGPCRSSMESAWSCLILPLSSVFEHSDRICWLQRGIAFLQRVLQCDVCSSKWALRDQICCLVLSQKMRCRFGNSPNLAGAQSTYTLREGWKFVLKETILGSKTWEKQTFFSLTLGHWLPVLQNP